VRFHYGWDQLRRIFPFPESYGLGSEIQKFVELGYTVTEDDHTIIDGSEGGGLIVVRRDTRRWFPMVLLRTECTFQNPPGFSRPIDYGCYALVPRLTAAHRLGLEPIPSAPSPLFSVEDATTDDFSSVAFAYDRHTPATSLSVENQLSRFGVRCEPLTKPPELVEESFMTLREEQLEYRWYRIQSASLDIRFVFAVVVYVGLELAAHENGALRLVHLFSSRFLPGIPLPSAGKWKQRLARRIRIASDW
jgi:hypothetical protein